MRARIQGARTFWALRSAEREIVRDAAVGLAVTWAGLRLLGFRRWKDLVIRRSEEPATLGSEASEPKIPAIRIRQLEGATARNLFFATNCLEQSLVLWSLLRRRGFPADLKFGARKEAGRFEAHAWVELNGCALDSESDEHREFIPFEGAIASVETQAK
jgi:hypothetical protein